MLQAVIRNIDSFLDRTVYYSLLVFLAALTFSTALMEISFGVGFIAWAFLKFRKPALPPLGKSLGIPLLTFTLISMLSFFWSEYPKQSFRGILKVAEQILLFWMVTDTLRDPNRHFITLRTLVWIFFFLGLDGMWQYVFGKDLLRQIPYEDASSGPRISASFHNYGLLAAFVVPFWPLLMASLGERGNKKNSGLAFLTALGSVFGSLLLFWTRLRGAWVAFVGGLFFLLWVKKRWLYLSLLVFAIPLGIFLLPHSMTIHLDAERKEQSMIERFYLWDRSLQVIAAKPWTGTGINTYSVAHQKYDKTGNWRVRNYYAHNGYLQMAAETGLPSLAFFLVFLFFYFKQGLQSLHESGGVIDGADWPMAGVLTGIMNFLILGLFDTGFHNPQAVHSFWFLAGWGIAYQKIFLDRSNPRASFRTN